VSFRAPVRTPEPTPERTPGRTPYWWAFLKHPVNKAVALGMLGASVLMSLPWGGDGLGLGLLALAAIQLVGLVFVPGLPTFQATVDKADRQAGRNARRERLLQEIDAQGGSAHLRSYGQMCERVASLYRTASDRSTTLTEREVEQLDELTVDYARMCLSDAVARDTDKGDPLAVVTRKLREVENRLAGKGLGRDDEQQLRQAKADYEESIARHQRMGARRSALEASLVSMPVRMEEVFQMVMSSPQAGNLGQLLEESVSKLRLAEEAALDMEHALGPVRSEIESPRSAQSVATGPGRRAVGQRE
jgi:hypothetical protein